MNIETFRKKAIRAIKERSIQFRGKTVRQFYTHLPFGKNGTRPRIVSTSKEKLLERVNEYFDQFASLGSIVTEITPSMIYDTIEAKNILAASNISESLSVAIQNYANLQGSVMLDGNKSIGDVYNAYLESKLRISSPEEISATQSRIGKFAAWCGKKAIKHIDAETVKVYMRGFDFHAPRTYNNTLKYLKTFFNWCCNPEHQYLLRNPIQYFKTKPIEWKEPAYLPVKTTEEMFRELEESKDYPVLARMVLWFFCGIRQAEIDRIAEGDEGGTIDTNENVVRIKKPKGYTKGVAARAFSMQENVLAWFAKYDLLTHLRSSVISESRRRATELLCKYKQKCQTVNVSDKNLGRHSFITYHVAKFKEPHKTETLCGTSRQMLANHYCGLASEADGKAYFNIVPSL